MVHHFCRKLATVRHKNTRMFTTYWEMYRCSKDIEFVPATPHTANAILKLCRTATICLHLITLSTTRSDSCILKWVNIKIRHESVGLHAKKAVLLHVHDSNISIYERCAFSEGAKGCIHRNQSELAGWHGTVSELCVRMIVRQNLASTIFLDLELIPWNHANSVNLTVHAIIRSLYTRTQLV